MVKSEAENNECKLKEIKKYEFPYINLKNLNFELLENILYSGISISIQNNLTTNSLILNNKLNDLRNNLTLAQNNILNMFLNVYGTFYNTKHIRSIFDLNQMRQNIES